MGKATASRPDSVVVTNGIYDEGTGGWLTLIGNKHWIHKTNNNDIGMTVVGSDGSIEGAGLIYLGYGNSSIGPANFIAGNKLNINGTEGENVGIIMTKLKDDGSAATREQGIYGNGNVGIGSGVLITSKNQINGTYPVKAVAIGYDTRVYAINGISIGYNAYNDTLGGIALGSQSYTSSEGRDQNKYNGEMIKVGYNPSHNATPITATWQNTNGELSIGKYDKDTGVSSVTRRIANVAAGVLDADAVNVAQLKAVELKVQDDNATNQNTSYFNLKNDPLKFISSENLTAVVNGTTQNVSYTLNSQLKNITSITNNTGTTNTGTVLTLNNNGLSLNTKKINGLSAGNISANSSDAINGDQLHTKLTNITTALGGGAAVGVDGVIAQPSYKLMTKTDGKVGDKVGAANYGGTGGTYSNVGDALAALDKGLATTINTGLIFSNGITDKTAKLGKKITIESAGATDKDKLITVDINTDGADDAKFSLGINTDNLKDKLKGSIANGNTGFVTGGDIATKLAEKVDITTYNNAMGGKFDVSKAKFMIQAGTEDAREVNLNTTTVPTLALTGEGPISVAFNDVTGNTLKVSAATVNTTADITNKANAGKLVTAAGLTAYTRDTFAKKDATNLVTNGASDLDETALKNWGTALSKGANIDTTEANTKGILVTDNQVGKALSELTINYKYNTGKAKSVKLSDGFTFKVGDGERGDDTKSLKKGLAISVEDNGIVTFGLDKETRDKIDSAIASTNEFIVEAGTNTTVSKNDKETGKIKYTVNLNDALTDVNSITSKANTDLTLTRNAGSSISLTDNNISLTAGTGADAKTITLGQDGRLSGISDGVNDTDAVNVKQLNAKFAPIGNIRNELLTVEQNTYAGIAGAVATANIPQSINSNKRNVFGIGYGRYHGQSALAMGISGTNKTKDVLWRITSSYDSTDSWSVGAGLGFTFGAKTHSYSSGLEDVIKNYEERINNLEKENEEIKFKNKAIQEQYESRIAKLENVILGLKK